MKHGETSWKNVCHAFARDPWRHPTQELTVFDATASIYGQVNWPAPKMREMCDAPAVYGPIHRRLDFTLHGPTGKWWYFGKKKCWVFITGFCSLKLPKSCSRKIFHVSLIIRLQFNFENEEGSQAARQFDALRISLTIFFKYIFFT